MSSTKDKPLSSSMEINQHINIDSIKTQNYSPLIDQGSLTKNGSVHGHELNDHHTASTEPQAFLIKSSLQSMQKFHGHGYPQQWLTSLLDKFDLLQVSFQDRNNYVPELLTGEALLWCAQQQEHMPTFLTFIKAFLQRYAHSTSKFESLPTRQSSHISVDNKETLNTTSSVLDCLRDQMLIANLEKLQKFSGNQKQHVSNWLQEIQNTMNMFKLTDEEKLFYISLCLTDNARDWFYDNSSLHTTWNEFTQNLLTTFESSGRADISFNRLHHYEQSLNQNVRQYYFDIMRLCKEANPSMNDATKLQYLKDGLKSSLRFDVLLKNPQTTKEFFDYVQRIEELKSLDDKHDIPISIDDPTAITPSTVNPISMNDKFEQTQSLRQSRQLNLKSLHTSQHANQTNSNYQIYSTSNKAQHPPTTNSTSYQCYKCGGYDHYIRNCPYLQ